MQKYTMWALCAVGIKTAQLPILLSMTAKKAIFALEMAVNGSHKGLLNILLRYGIPVVVSAGLCYVLFSKVDFRENVEIVSRYCNFWWIGASLALSVFSHVVRALRWGLQLKALDIDVKLKNLVLSIFGTYAVNIVLPRLGEVWRTGYIANLKHASFTRVFGSMLSDRLADTLTVLIISLMAFALASGTIMDYIASEPGRLESVSSLLSSSWLWTAVGLVIVGGWVILTRFPDNRAVAAVKKMWKSLWEGFIVIARMPGRWMWLFYTILLWGCYFVQLYLNFFAFDFTAQIVARDGAVAVLVCFVLSTLAMILPSNGGYGPWQMAVIYGLGFYAAGVTLPPGKTFEAMSIGFANCVMTCQTILLIVLGLITFVAIALEKRQAGRPSRD